MTTTPTIQEQLAERFESLPKSVQDAVTSADVEKKLRALSQKHKLHLDQWVLLENEIMLTLLGIEEPENMSKNIEREVRVTPEVAQNIVNDIAVLIFAPIRESLQKGIPSETLARKTTTETVQSDSAGLILPNQELPQSSQNEKRGPTDLNGPAYQTGTSSLERKNVQGDPYREPLE